MNDSLDSSAADRPTPEGKPAGSRRGKVRLLPPLHVVLAATAFAVMAAAAQIALADYESAIANIVTLILGFLALVTLLGWFTLWSGYPWFVRWAPIAVIGGLCLAAAAMYEVDYVSGALIPTFKRRGSIPKDATLEAPRLTASEHTVDLATTTPHDFPQFLGKDRNLTARLENLATDWKATPPVLVWKQPIGAGLSAFSAVHGYAVTQEQRGAEEWVSCYEIASGKMQWRHAEQTRHETILGRTGPRATPTIAEGRVYAQGATGILLCLDGATGELIWKRELLEEFGVGSPADDLKGVAWGRAGSPLVAEGLVIVPAGGPASGKRVSLAAYDAATGKERWRGGENQISYSSPSLAFPESEHRQVLIVNESSVAGHDLESGAQLWEFPWPGSSTTNASASQAVGLPGYQVFVSKGYGGGAALFQLQEGKPQWKAEAVWEKTSVMKTKLTNVAIRDGHVFGLSEGVLECIALKTGERKWKGGRYGHGQILLVDEHLLVLSEEGELAAVAATPAEYRELARIQAIEGQTWNNLCLFGDLLLIRNSEQAACYRLPMRPAASGG